MERLTDTRSRWQVEIEVSDRNSQRSDIAQITRRAVSLLFAGVRDGLAERICEQPFYFKPNSKSRFSKWTSEWFGFLVSSVPQNLKDESSRYTFHCSALNQASTGRRVTVWPSHMAYLAINAVTREARARASTAQHQTLSDRDNHSPNSNLLWGPTNEYLSTMGRSRVCGKRPCVPFLPPPQPPLIFESSLQSTRDEFERFITQTQPQQPNSSATFTSEIRSLPATPAMPLNFRSTTTLQFTTVRARSTSSPAIPVPNDSLLSQKLDRDELESELSSHYFESRTEAMLEKLRCSASSIDMDRNHWDSTSFFDCDGIHQGVGQFEPGAAVNTLDESAPDERCDDGDEIFALEISDEQEMWFMLKSFLFSCVLLCLCGQPCNTSGSIRKRKLEWISLSYHPLGRYKFVALLLKIKCLGE